MPFATLALPLWPRATLGHPPPPLPLWCGATRATLLVPYIWLRSIRLAIIARSLPHCPPLEGKSPPPPLPPGHTPRVGATVNPLISFSQKGKRAPPMGGHPTFRVGGVIYKNRG